MIPESRASAIGSVMKVGTVRSRSSVMISDFDEAVISTRLI
jgi:hypothetical protein